MGRGRKKGGIKVNDINDVNELREMIINQINSLNKKIKAFKNDGNEDHMEFVKSYVSSDIGQFTPNGTISKSRKFYKDKNKVWLKKSLATFVKLNNNDIYGTPNKYRKIMTAQLKSVKSYVEGYLRKKGYDENFIMEVTNSKDFYVKLFDAFGENTDFESNQSIDKVALSYKNTGFSDKQKNKILSNIEYSHNVAKRIQEEQQAFEEFKNQRNNAKR